MKICKNEITDYTYANFTEDETLWTLASLYNNGDTARDGHYIYKYAGTTQTNSTVSPSNDPLLWLVYKSSNYYAMLGDRTSEQTEVNDEIIVEIELNRYDTLALLNLDAYSVTIQYIDNDTDLQIGDDIVYDLANRDVYNFTTFFFAPFVYKNSFYISPPYFTNTRARITIEKTGSIAKCGRLVSGRNIDIGDALFKGVSLEKQSYSSIETDEFGTTTLIKRAAIFNSSYSIKTFTQNVPYIQKLSTTYDATPILFIGDPESDSKLENLLTYGLWETSTIELNGAYKTDMNLTIKKLL